MNREALEIIRDWCLAGGDAAHAPKELVELRPRFDMSAWEHCDGCGTALCIGGAASAIMRARGFPSPTSWETQAWLGMSDVKADALFSPELLWYRLTPAMAAEVIQRLLDTGEVQWDAVYEEMK